MSPTMLKGVEIMSMRDGEAPGINISTPEGRAEAAEVQAFVKEEWARIDAEYAKDPEAFYAEVKADFDAIEERMRARGVWRKEWDDDKSPIPMPV
ncbi:MAG: hypothetical protein FWG08_01855 [Propionibacteriaceae bacterium]|nr:hypothetical protein [Propionibacteriaceae bacterium]